MKKSLTKIMVVSACTIALSVTAYAVTKKISAASGYQIINTSGMTVTTENPTACQGITFPGSVNDADNQSIQIANNTPVSSFPCAAVYSNYCTVELSLTESGAVQMTATSPDNSCQMALNGYAVEMTSTSS